MICKYQDCTGLKSITIPDNVTSIEDYAFHNCEKLDTIHCLCTDPPVIHDDSFDEHTYTASTLFVPKGSIEAYRKANGWKQFKRIEEEKNDEVFKVLIIIVPSLIVLILIVLILIVLILKVKRKRAERLSPERNRL